MTDAIVAKVISISEEVAKDVMKDAAKSVIEAMLKDSGLAQQAIIFMQSHTRELLALAVELPNHFYYIFHLLNMF